jgi:hypothetical protein
MSTAWLAARRFERHPRQERGRFGQPDLQLGAARTTHSVRIQIDQLPPEIKLVVGMTAPIEVEPPPYHSKALR